MPPLTAKTLPKIGKRVGKIRKKEEKSGRKGKNWEGSFTLPLLTDRAGYATGVKWFSLLNEVGHCGYPKKCLTWYFLLLEVQRKQGIMPHCTLVVGDLC